MKRFIVTSPSWVGEAEIVYNDAGKLARLSFEGCTIPEHDRVVCNFKFITPVSIDKLQEAFAPTSATIVEADFEVNFDMFWKSYNLKHNRLRAVKLWDKLSKTDQVKAYYGIPVCDKFLKKENWRSKADPETYLRNKMYDNEY